MDETEIRNLCDRMGVTVATLKVQAEQLIERFAQLDAAARANLNDPLFTGTVASLIPTREARDALRYYLIDELHQLIGIPAPRREVYYLEGCKRVSGPAEGNLADRVVPSLIRLRTRIDKARTRAATAAGKDARQ